MLLLTPRRAGADRQKGLALGADDGLTRPFALPERVARAKAILRRAGGARTPGAFRSGPFRFDLTALTATREGRDLGLTARELRLLAALVANPGRTCSRGELLELAWEADARPSPRTIDVHVAKLRKKLGDTPAGRSIATVEGEGYRWTLAVDD